VDIENIKEKYLSIFMKNNPQCKVICEGDMLIIDQPWGFEENRLIFSLEKDEKIIKDLNNMYFRSQFDALMHLDKNIIEFLYGYILPEVEPSKSLIGRKFTLHFNGNDFECYFEKPTDRVNSLARHIKWLPTEHGNSIVPQLRAFRDVQRLEKLPNVTQKFFVDRIPQSFYIKPNCSLSKVEIDSLSRHVNFLMTYYDRESPFIVVREKDSVAKKEIIKPKRYIETKFPEVLTIGIIDDIILKLMEVAFNTAARFAFLYYYQIFEYAGFYFVDEKTKRSLRAFLRNPTILDCAEERVNELFSTLIELNCADEVRMQKIIEEYCNPEAIWQEILNDKEFFSKEVIFDGGFELSALVSADTTEGAWCTMWMPKFFTHLTKIRNCLVHAREKRQEKVILPSKKNNELISRYIPLIKRAAEQIAIYKL